MSSSPDHKPLELLDPTPESPTTARPLEMDDDDVHDAATAGEEHASQESGTISTTAAPAGSNPGPGATTGAASAASPHADDMAPPPQPPRPLNNEAHRPEQVLKEAFPTIDLPVIKAVLTASRGNVEQAFNALLEMTDPDAAQRNVEETPPPPPPRPAQAALGPTSTKMSQLEADELYARQLAERYENEGAYEARTTNNARGPEMRGPRGRQQAGPRLDSAVGGNRRGHQNNQNNQNNQNIDPDYDDDGNERQHSFLDDELPAIRENLRKGFVETQTKVNSWFSTIKKRINEEFNDDDEPARPGAAGAAGSQGQNAFVGRPARDQVRRNADYDRYDADPELLSDDFAGMKFHADGTPVQRTNRQPTNPNLFRPPAPAKSPRLSSEGRRVAFSETVEDIDAYNASPRLPVKEGTFETTGGTTGSSGAAAGGGGPGTTAGGAGGGSGGGKPSKWQPLSTSDASPAVETDPFILGDSEDEKDNGAHAPGGSSAGAVAKDQSSSTGGGDGGGGIKAEDAERLRQATADAMADSLVDDKAKDGDGKKE